MNFVFHVDDIVSNYQDSIKNVIYGLQKYSDEFLDYMCGYATKNNLTELSLSFDNPDFIGFLICESEDIMRNKILRSSIEICNVYQCRFNKLVKRIKRTNQDTSFIYSKVAFEKLRNVSKEIIKEDSVLVKHKNSTNALSKSVFNFNTLIPNVVISRYDDNNTNVLSRDELLSYLSGILDYTNTVMYGLKVLIEGCSSCIITATIVHDMVTCMIMGCNCISTIDVYRNI